MQRRSAGARAVEPPEPEVDDAEVRQAVERVLMVPDGHRRFTVSEADAARVHRIGPALVRRLLDLGLPHRADGPDGRRYDQQDLDNVGLSLRLPGPRWTAMRWWSESLDASDVDREVRYRVTATVSCPWPGHPGDCEFALHHILRERSVPGSYRRSGVAGAAFDVALWPLRYHFGEPFTDLIARIGRTRFHLLPPGLMRDFGFVAETGLADCALATLYFSHVGAEVGLPVRPVTGVFLAKPYSVPHHWLEFQVGNRWLSADPFLLNAFARWGITDPARWPPHRCPQGVLWRLANDRTTLATHRGAAVEPTFIVRPVT